MPCDSIVLNEIEFQATDRELLKKALEELGINVLRTLRDGTIVFRTQSWSNGRITNDKIIIDEREADIVDKIKQRYSMQVVKAAAKRFNWNVKQTSPNKLQITRRF